MVGEERGRETEYGMQVETECEVLLKGGCTEKEAASSEEWGGT